MINRFDIDNNQLQLGDIVKNRWTGEEFEVVFAEDILAFGLRNWDGHFEFMSEWISSDWEIIRRK